MIMTMTASMTPRTERMTKGEFCPVSSGSPSRMNTAPNAQNNFATAALYFLTLVTSKVLIFAQKPADFLEKRADRPSAMNRHPIRHQMIKAMIVSGICIPP